jgi:nucleotide-binding universal stress UspA family protein
MSASPILVGTDGSEDSLRAAAWAAREATARGQRLMIVSVLAPAPRMSLMPPGEAAARAARRGAERALVAAVQRARGQASGLRTDTEVLSGEPARVLVAQAAHASMLVVGSRGAGGFAAMVLGSVSRHAATHAPCPVVVVREESMAVHREIVVGVRDPELPEACAAIGFAFEEAALRKARLLAVHAWYWPSPAAHLDQPEMPGDMTRLLADALSVYQDKFPGVEVITDVVRAHPGRLLASASARADLVVVGRHDALGTHTHGVGSVVYALLHHGQGPVAIVPGC